MSMEDKKMKGKMDETPTSGVAESKLSQCLTLGNSPVVGEPSSSSKTSNDLDSSMKSSEPSNDHKENPPLEYACQYCDRKFSSSQALGGHQNGHKHERVLKKEKEKFLHGHEFGAHFSTHPYPRMVNNYQHSPSHLYYGARFHRPVAQLPSLSLPFHSSLGYAHYQGLHVSNTSFVGHRYGNNSGSSLGGVGATPPRYNLQGVRLFHGINQFPPPANNEEANQVQAHAGVGNPLENSSVSRAASQASEEMDLTLKLGFP